jgi:TusA-related sulfurtransferase
MSLIEEKLRLAEMSVNEVIETLQDRGEGVQLKASEMLRQQQAEIEALKAENKKYEKHIAIGYLEELKK